MSPELDPPVYDENGKLIKLARGDAEWKSILTPEQYRIARQADTETPGNSAFHRFDLEGVYHCIACGLALYSSETKFEHCAGWPSFTEPVDPRHVVARPEPGGSLHGAEAVCGRCDSHLGHVFLDGPLPARTRHWINSAALRFAGQIEVPDAAQPVGKIETAVFGMGWFWGPDARFGRLDGVIRTIVGYSGGLSPSPNYRAIADHTETIEIVYDSGKISYGRLLEEFWKGHDPTQGGGARQYRSVILVAGEGQRRLAMQSRDAESARLGKPVRTAIEPLQFLWPAEEYHQKYYLQGRKDLFGAFRKALGAESGWYMTSSAARLNAFVAGEIDADSLMRDLGSFDLPAGFTDNLAPLLPGK